jgi:uncharacterized membrane protein SirB2
MGTRPAAFKAGAWPAVRVAVCSPPIPSGGDPVVELVTVLKPLHVSLALLSGAGFALRGVWMLQGSAWLDARFTRVAPHVVDTALLLSGVGLAVLLRLSPAASPWLAAKLLLLIPYVAAGMLALRRGRTRRIRAAALAVALAAYGLILASALTHRPLGLV